MNNESLGWMWDQVLAWTNEYGYHAVVPVLLADPAGVPWAWIFLMMLADEARLNSWWLLGYGFVVLTLNDHLLYWLGVLGGQPLVKKLGARWPKVAEAMLRAEWALEGRGVWVVAFGRFLPLIGRWVGVGAGLARVSFWRFVLYDLLGVTLTVIGFGAAADFIGKQLAHRPWFPQAVAITFIASTVLTILFIIWQARGVKKTQRLGEG